jgi:hypothetical protein
MSSQPTDEQNILLNDSEEESEVESEEESAEGDVREDAEEDDDTDEVGIRIIDTGNETGIIIPFEYIMRLGQQYPREERSPMIEFECSICEDLKSASSFYLAGWAKRSIEELEDSGKNGCEYCSLLAKGIRTCVPEDEFQDEQKLLDRFARTLPEGKEGRPANKYGISIFTLPSDQELWADCAVPVGWFPSGDTKSDLSMATAKGWLENCIETHPTCGNGSEQPAPTRLLDVSPEDGSDVKLIEAGGTLCRYATLSHCWGQTEAITTTVNSLEAHKTGIAWSDLCLTFQEAIIVTRNLGLKYIWIDSLCIIQDDEVDWRKEAMQMASIYEFSHITISATLSKDHDGGCFSKLSREFEAHRVSISAADGELTLYFRLMLPHCPYIIQSVEQAMEFPVIDRGWVYQERLLSPRVLHFYTNEIAWECNTVNRCECLNPTASSNQSKRALATQTNMNQIRNPKESHTHSLHPSGDLANLALRWHEIVKEYSGLKITYEKDALPALAGLARQMMRYREEGEKYFAGLWSRTFFYDMLWSAEDDRASRPKVYRGPSWSWIATTSPVNYDRAHVYAIVELYAEFLNGSITLAGNDHFGEVERPTFIYIKGLLINGRLRYTDAAKEEGEVHSAGADGGRKPDYEIVVNGEAVGPFDADYGLRLDKGEDYIPDDFLVWILLFAKSDNNFFYVVLSSVTLLVETDEHGNVLEDGPRIVDTKPMYERIGLLTISSRYEPIHTKGGIESWVESFIIR